MLSVGVLSTASIVPRFIAAAQDSGCCRVAAIASRSEAAAQQMAERFGIAKAFGSYEALLAEPGVDAVYVANISSEHALWTKKALQAGRHVLCEKPFALEPRQAEESFALAREKGLFVMEMQKAVFLPVIAEIRRAVRQGDVGRIFAAEFSSSFSSGYNDWFTDLSRGGGPWFSNAGYTAALLQYLFDCPIERAEGLCTRSSGTAEDQFSVTFSMANGVLAACRSSTAVALPNTAILYGERGTVEIPEFWKARRAVIRADGKAPETLDYPCAHELIYEIRHAARCIAEGLTESPVMTVERTVGTVRILHEVSEGWKQAGLIG